MCFDYLTVYVDQKRDSQKLYHAKFFVSQFFFVCKMLRSREKSLVLAENRTPAVQPVSHHYAEQLYRLPYFK
jgi:hypothetical protein